MDQILRHTLKERQIHDAFFQAHQGLPKRIVDSITI